MVSRSRILYTGRLCRTVAWIIGLVGLIADAIIFFLNFQSSNNGPGSSPSLNDLFYNLVIALVIAMPVLFFAFIYATGTFLSYMGTEQKTKEETLRAEDEPVSIMPLPER